MAFKKLAVFGTLALATLGSVSEARPVSDNAPSRRLLFGPKYPAPSQDPFYIVPANVSAYANGAIIRERDVTADSGGGVDKSTYSKVTQVLYKTQDALGNDDATVSTLYKPKAPKAGVPQIVSVALFEDSAALDCANSNALIDGTSSQGALIVGAQAPLITASLTKGYYVSAPDYLGSKAAFIAGYTEGRAMLDGTRAILNHKPTIANTAGYQVILNGYSGGGHGAGWAVQLQPEYAPELNIIGAAYGGLPVNLSATLLNLNKGLFSGFGFAGLAGAANAYPELENYLRPKLYQNGTDAFTFLRSAQACVPGELANFAFKDYFTYVKGGMSVIYEAIPQKYFQLNLLGGRGAVDTVNKYPLYIFHSKNDEVIPRAPVDQYVKDQCSKGASIAYSLSDPSDHVTETFINIASTMQWINARFDGTLKQKGCTNGTHSIFGADALTQAVGPAAAKQIQNLYGFSAKSLF